MFALQFSLDMCVLYKRWCSNCRNNVVDEVIYPEMPIEFSVWEDYGT